MDRIARVADDYMLICRPSSLEGLTTDEHKNRGGCVHQDGVRAGSDPMTGVS